MPEPTETAAARKRLSAEDRRTAILNAALGVFASRGFHGASIDEIAQAAGISKALIYEHFPSKRELHASLIELHVSEIFERLASLGGGVRPHAERLRAGVDAFLAWVESHETAFRLIFRDSLEADVAEVIERLQRQATFAIADLMARSTGYSDRPVIETYAQLLSGGVQSLAIWWRDHPEVSRDFLVDRVMEFAWTGLERISNI